MKILSLSRKHTKWKTAVVLLFFALSTPAWGRGWAIIKSHTTQDIRHAAVVEYRTATVLDNINYLTLPDGSSRRVLPGLLVAMVDDYDASSQPDIISSEDQAMITVRLIQLQDYRANFPQLGRRIDPTIALLREEVNKMNSGQVKVSNVWMSAAEYRKRIADAQNREQDVRRQAEAAQEAEQQAALQLEKDRREAIETQAKLEADAKQQKLAAEEAEKARLAKQEQEKQRQIEREALAKKEEEKKRAEQVLLRERELTQIMTEKLELWSERW